MNLFIIAKQILDLLYQFKFLQYVMLLVAIGLILYGVITKKVYKDVKGFVIIPDIFVIVLMVLYTIAYLKVPEHSYKQFVKTMSAFVIYFLGRVYGEDVVKKSWGISEVAYVILYSNVVVRVIEFITHVKENGPGWWQYYISQYLEKGGLYFYKTDLAIGVITCIIFIYVYGKNHWFKYFSIFGVGGLLVFLSSARMGQVILLVEYVLIIILELRKWLVKNNKKVWSVNGKCVITVFSFIAVSVTILFIFLQLSPIHKCKYEELDMDDYTRTKLENIFHSRHTTWWDALNYYSNQNIIVRATGIDLYSETEHNSNGDRFHSLYMKMIYSVGYIGTYMFLALVAWTFVYVVKSKNYQLKVLTVGFWTMFLLIAVSMEAFESVQMSWMPFIYSGAVLSAGNRMIDKKQENS